MPGPNHQEKTMESVPCGILTVSDTRTRASDKSGALIRERLESAGHHVVGYEIVPDEPGEVRASVERTCAEGACRAIVINGGTGLAPRDSTYEAITALLDKRLDGFGELFRSLSYEEIGAAAMLSRAVAGVRGRTVIFSIPGSTGAVRLAVDKLILPELGHVAWLVGGS